MAGDARLPRYKINETEFAQADVVPELGRIFAARRERVIFVKGDPGMDFGSVAGAVGMGQQAGATVGLLTRRE